MLRAVLGTIKTAAVAAVLVKVAADTTKIVNEAYDRLKEKRAAG